MEWWMVLLIFFGLLILFMAIGMPIAIAFLVVNITVISMVFGFTKGMDMLVLSSYEAIAKFTLIPIPLFVFMGEILLHSGVAFRTLDTLSNLLGKIPGRLSILAIGAGTLFAALSGSSIANTSMLGSVLVPEMRQRGYHTSLSVGPIMASGSLAVIIPPSTFAVIMGSLGGISVGALLIAGIVPGIMLALGFICYYVGLCVVKPELAPAYEVERIPLMKRIGDFLINVFPLVLLIAIVLGMFFFGWTTPTEAAAVGALGSFLIAVLYRCMNWEIFKKSVLGTLLVSGMIMLIIVTSSGFSQLLSFTGVTRHIINGLLSWDIAPIFFIILMLAITFILGMFLEPVAIMMMTIPLFIPMVTTLQYDLVWFGTLMLVMLSIGNLTPPFGMLLFVMKGVNPNLPMATIYQNAMPVVIICVLVVAIMMIFPGLVTWLPSLIGR